MDHLNPILVSPKYPEEVFTIEFFRFPADATSPDAWNICFDLYMDEFGAFHIAAEDVRIWCVAKGDYC